MSPLGQQVLPASPLFHVPDMAAVALGAVLTVTGPEAHHAVTVRRLRVGEQIQLTDGRGRVVSGAVQSAPARDRVDVEVQQIVDVAAPTPTVTVVQALLKGSTGADAVDSLTEVGVDRVIPWIASRCVTRTSAGESVARWERAAQEAGKQSRRAWWPSVATVVDTVGLVALVRERRSAGAQVVVLHESSSEPLPAVLAPTPSDIVLIVGPEGGLTEDEVAHLHEVGGTPVSLGPTVLRAALAGAVAAGVALAGMGRWRVAPVDGMTGSAP